MKPTTYLFDLDMTLVDSSAVAKFRAQRNWQAVRDNLSSIKPLETQAGIRAHEVPALLKGNRCRVGIITSSPRHYAEQVCRKFDIPFDVLVAFHDTEQHKPDPHPITRALEQLRVPAQSACHIGDSPLDAEASHHAGVLSVMAGWSVPSGTFDEWMERCKAAADVWLIDPGPLVKGFDPDSHGYLGEVMATNGEPTLHHGSFLLYQHEEGDWYGALGRYFTREDGRAAGSPWSHRILSLKDGDDYAEFFAQVLVTLLKGLKRRPDVVVPVPPKPNQRNRFAGVLREVSRQLPSIRVALDGLTCTKRVEGYKKLGGRQRAESIQGAFVARARYPGRVLVLDDVATTGATAGECARALRAAAASDVFVLALGMSQRPFERRYCEECRRPMKVKDNRKSGGQFWGCTGFPGCRKTVDIKPAPVGDSSIPF